MTKRKDFTGKRFGKLVVIRIFEKIGKQNILECQCDCGVIKNIRQCDLVNGSTLSCGCWKREYPKINFLKDMIGKRFDSLVVLEVDHIIKKTYYWKCQCDCGNIIIANTQFLRYDGPRSCGCLGQKRRVPVGTAQFNQIYSRYRVNAKNKNLGFTLTRDEFSIITQQNCFYCGIEPYQTIKSKHDKGSFTYNGIDRIDSKKGYIEGNMVPCCGKCNILKNNSTQKDFLELIGKIYNNLVINSVMI